MILLLIRFFKGCCPGLSWNAETQQCERKMISFRDPLKKNIHFILHIKSVILFHEKFKKLHLMNLLYREDY